MFATWGSVWVRGRVSVDWGAAGPCLPARHIAPHSEAQSPRRSSKPGERRGGGAAGSIGISALRGESSGPD